MLRARGERKTSYSQGQAVGMLVKACSQRSRSFPLCSDPKWKSSSHFPPFWHHFPVGFLCRGLAEGNLEGMPKIEGERKFRSTKFCLQSAGFQERKKKFFLWLPIAPQGLIRP